MGIICIFDPFTNFVISVLLAILIPAILLYIHRKRTPRTESVFKWPEHVPFFSGGGIALLMIVILLICLFVFVC